MSASPAPRWTQVKWTEAGQIVGELDDVPIAPDQHAAPPREWWADRVTAGDLSVAVRFLAMALPRLEAVAWALQTIERCVVPNAGERMALDAISRWIQSPDDALRRAAWARCAGLTGALHFAGVALFFSGGSIAPEELEPVHPAPALCATAAAGAILAAAYGTPDPPAALAAALAAGDRIAAGES